MHIRVYASAAGPWLSRHRLSRRRLSVFVVRMFVASLSIVFGPSCPSDFLGGPFFLVRFFVVSLCRQRPFRGTFSVTRPFFSCSVSALRARQPDRALLSTRCSGKAWRPKIAPHSLLISACEKGEQPGRALEALQAMQRQDRVPGDSAPTALRSARARRVSSSGPRPGDPPRPAAARRGARG